MGHDAGLGGRLGVEPRGDHLALRPASGLVRDGRLRAGVLLWLADWEACRAAVAEPLGAGTYRAEVRDEGAGLLLAAAVGVAGPVV